MQGSRKVGTGSRRLRRARRLLAAAVGLAVAAAWGSGGARADLMVTPDASDAGFRLATFASDFPTLTDPQIGKEVGPLGVAFTSDGGVLVTDKPGFLRFFATTDINQSATSASVVHDYTADKATGLAQVGNTIYMTRQTQGDVVALHPDGSFDRVVIAGLAPYVTGIAANPANGHLFVTTLGVNAVYDIDPVAGTKSLFASLSADGVTISPDGKTVYAVEQRDDALGRVIGFDTATHAKVFDSGPIGGMFGEVDGVALGIKKLAGQLFVNTHNGEVYSIDLATRLQTLIADGGSRGDFLTVNPEDGSILVTQSDSLLRLTGPTNIATTPLPRAATFGGLLAAGVVAHGRRRWRQPTATTGG